MEALRCRGKDKVALIFESHVIIHSVVDLTLIMAPVPGIPSPGPTSPTAQQIKQSREDDVKQRGEQIRKELEIHLPFLVEYCRAAHIAGVKIHDS